MAYRVKEIFYTLQGEGVRAGRPAVFCRFAGCNLWSGRPEDRGTARCHFCDTDFVGADAGTFATAEALANAISSTFPQTVWEYTRNCPSNQAVKFPTRNSRVDEATGKILLSDGWHPYVVFTGGEPALQLAPDLLDCLHQRGYELAVETNGTLPLPVGIDWITVSPKGANRLITCAGDELKLVWPQPECSPEDFSDLDFDHFILQPCDNANLAANTQLCVDYCLAHPRWRLSLQTHKFLGIR